MCVLVMWFIKIGVYGKLMDLWCLMLFCQEVDKYYDLSEILEKAGYVGSYKVNF